jgi:hypothetical protein
VRSRIAPAREHGTRPNGAANDLRAAFGAPAFCQRRIYDRSRAVSGKPPALWRRRRMCDQHKRGMWSPELRRPQARRSGN